jgi:Caspase domain
VQVKPSPYSAGVFRAYATQLDNVASDGAGRNSPFTKALLKHIETKGISIQELMIRVRKSVMEDTKNQQVPWEEAALNDVFYFVTPSVALPMGIGPKAPAPSNTGGGAPAAARPNNLPPNIGFGVGGGL